MMKHVVLSAAMACLIAGPVMARGNSDEGRQERKEKIENLTDVQKGALEKFHTSMKELRESNKEQRPDKKADRKADKEAAKAAFISGDFDKLEALKDEHKQERDQSMKKHQQAKIKAMQNAFGELSEKDREVLADIVLKKKRPQGPRPKRANKDTQE